MTRMQKALNEIAYLWKKDDRGWMKKRKEDWITLVSFHRFNEISAKEKKLLKTYFLEGVLEEYYPPNAIMLFTPCETEGQVRQAFYSGLFDLESMRRLMSEYIPYASKVSRSIDLLWVKNHIRNFCYSVLGQEYQEIIWKFSGSGNITCISPDTTQWPMVYMRVSEELFNGEISYHGYTECLDYFISILSHSTDPDFRRPKYLINMLTAAESAKENPGLSVDIQEFAKKVCSRKQDILNAWNVNAHLDEVKVDG